MNTWREIQELFAAQLIFREKKARHNKVKLNKIISTIFLLRMGSILTDPDTVQIETDVLCKHDSDLLRQHICLRILDILVTWDHRKH